MGRPKVGEPVLIRLPAELIAQIDVSAAELGITRPELIRRRLSGLGSMTETGHTYASGFADGLAVGRLECGEQHPEFDPADSARWLAAAKSQDEFGPWPDASRCRSCGFLIHLVGEWRHDEADGTCDHATPA